MTLTPTRLAGFAAMTTLIYLALMPVIAWDLRDYLVPWFNTIRDGDGISVFADPFTNYTAGYVTVLWLWSFAEPWLGTFFSIKAAALTGTALCAGAFHSVLAALDLPRDTRAFGVLAVLALPTVAMNGAALAQADAFYTAFILWALAAILRGKPAWAGLAFAVAISFKLQAVFFAPFLAGVMLRSPRAIVISAVALVPVYLTVNTLYLAGGRSVMDVLQIYADQGGYYQDLWKRAANPWWLVQMVVPEAVQTSRHAALMGIGVLGAAAAGLAILIQTLRQGPRPSHQTLLFWATVSAFAMPFLLPKMHDRYFFLAEVLVLALALVDKRFWATVILAQASGALAYCGHSDVLGFKALLGQDLLHGASFALMCGALYTLFRPLQAAHRDLTAATAS